MSCPAKGTYFNNQCLVENIVIIEHIINFINTTPARSMSIPAYDKGLDLLKTNETFIQLILIHINAISL